MIEVTDLHAFARHLIKHRLVNHAGEYEDVVFQREIFRLGQSHRARASFSPTINLVSRSNQQHASLADADEGVVLNNGVPGRPDRYRLHGPFTGTCRNDEVVASGQGVRVVRAEYPPTVGEGLR